MPVLTPDLFHLTAQELIDCVCAALNLEADCPCPCRTCVVNGPAARDNCCDGQLTAWLENVFYHENFPNPARDATICPTFLAGNYVIEYLMCQPTVKDDGSPPTCAEESEAARKVSQSLYIAINALSCCLSEARRHRKYVITDGRPIAPEGGCAGWQIRLTIELHDPLP